MLKMNKKLQLLFILLITLFFLSIVVIICMHYNSIDNEIELTQFATSDINTQMMGYELKTASGKVILVDSGTKSDSEKLAKKIKEDGNKVDYWFITHGHHDHAEAFCDIVEKTNIEIERIYISLNDLEWYEQNCEPHRLEFLHRLYNVIKNSRIKEKVIEPKLNDIIQIDTNLKAEILGIKNPEITENAMNEQSMVISFITKENKILFLGDTGIKSSKKLLDTQREKLKSNIVQMAHHGQNGASKELYEAISPKVCLFPTPLWLWNNDNGNGYDSGEWKTLETRKWIEELNVEKYFNGENDIVIKVK